MSATPTRRPSPPPPLAFPLPAPGSPPAPVAGAPRPLGPDERALRRERIVDVLWALQEERGWIDDEAVARAASECGLTEEEVDEIATFYNLLLRRPAGRVRLYVCDSISCHLRGGDELMARLAETLGIAPGEVTADGQIDLLPTVCLGHCEKAPCVLAGETVHGPCGTGRAEVETLIRKVLDGRGPAQGQG